MAHPRRHLHQQGRARDEGAAGGAGRLAARDLAVGTFHAICARILRREAGAGGLGWTATSPSTTTTTSSGWSSASSRDMDLNEKQFKPAHDPQHHLARQERPAQPQRVRASASTSTSRRSPPASISATTRRCASNNAVDFDDLILLTYQLWRRNPDVLERVSAAATTTSTWTSSRTPTTRSTSWCGCSARARRRRLATMNVCAVADDDQCLIEGTLITMADGSQRPIEDVAAGDIVLSGVWQRRVPARACRQYGAARARGAGHSHHHALRAHARQHAGAHALRGLPPWHHAATLLHLPDAQARRRLSPWHIAGLHTQARSSR